jgi:hypothetical protein
LIVEVKNKLTLLTTAFAFWPGKDNPHVHEIYAAILMNVMNELIYDVHVMTESPCSTLQEQIHQAAERMHNATRILKEFHRKFRCIPSPTGDQPRYKDFFEYANRSLQGNVVLLSNSDVVFDETLHRIDPEVILRGKTAFVLSVKPPPVDGKYSKTFGKECDNLDKCSVGSWQRKHWWPGGYSWDTYVFATPLPVHFDLSDLDIVMNRMGAENRAGYQFENAGITLYDPCYMVNAFHWHCMGGKLHNSDRVDTPGQGSVRNIGSCWYCPGITMPRGYAKREDLCRRGVRQGIWAIPSLKKHFKQPDISVEVCCANLESCRRIDVQWIGACKEADDVDCVMWEGVTNRHEYY